MKDGGWWQSIQSQQSAIHHHPSSIIINHHHDHQHHPLLSSIIIIIHYRHHRHLSSSSSSSFVIIIIIIQSFSHISWGHLWIGTSVTASHKWEAPLPTGDLKYRRLTVSHEGYRRQSLRYTPDLKPVSCIAFAISVSANLSLPWICVDNEVSPPV